MTTIIKNPKIADYFCEVSYPDVLTKESGIAPLFESGKLILLQDYPLDLDYSFLNTISFVDAQQSLTGKDVDRIQKLSYKRILSIDPRSLKNDLQKAIFEKSFEGDSKALRYYQEQVKQGHQKILQLFQDLFPRYDCFDLNGTWRFTPTLFENLHWDNFPAMDDRHQARIFINIDQNPRIWHTSHPLEDYCQDNYHQFNLAQFKDTNPNDIINFMDRQVLGGMNNRCLDGLERHSIAFEQGDIWLADSRLISHQIYQGNRAAIYMFHIKPESMHDPEMRFNRRIARLHQQLLK